MPRTSFLLTGLLTGLGAGVLRSALRPSFWLASSLLRGSSSSSPPSSEGPLAPSEGSAARSAVFLPGLGGSNLMPPRPSSSIDLWAPVVLRAIPLTALGALRSRSSNEPASGGAAGTFCVGVRVGSSSSRSTAGSSTRSSGSIASSPRSMPPDGALERDGCGAAVGGDRSSKKFCASGGSC